jgi:hypothetical protein
VYLVGSYTYNVLLLSVLYVLKIVTNVEIVFCPSVFGFQTAEKHCS